MEGNNSETNSEGTQPKTYGVTPPISSAIPTELDENLNKSLIKVLEKFNLFEKPEGDLLRQEVLGKLNIIVKEWIRKVCLKRGYSEQLAAEAGYKLFTYGSFRLGVHSPGSDIDTLCVAPRNVTRQDFFVDLKEMLEKDPDITELSIDLVFAQLAEAKIDETLDLLSENILKNLDQKSVLSLNGSRVTDEILRLVPNVDNFRMTLRSIKLWAQKRLLYSNKVGLLGGISWALLVARVCQLYPNAIPSTLLAKFFFIYQQWNWPTPVMLNHIQTYSSLNLKDRPWDSRVCPKDKSHLMPIITPAYPAQNSTYNVSKSTLYSIKNEFEKGKTLTEKIETFEENWEKLFEDRQFFVEYKGYIHVHLWASNEDELRTWMGFVESKLRHLIHKLEDYRTPNVLYAVPHPDKFVDASSGHPLNANYFLGIVLDFSKSDTSKRAVDFTPAVKDFIATITQFLSYTPEMGVDVNYVKKNNLPGYVFPGGKKRVTKRSRKSTKTQASPKKVKLSETEEATLAVTPTLSPPAPIEAQQSPVKTETPEEVKEEQPVPAPVISNENLEPILNETENEDWTSAAKEVKKPKISLYQG